MVRLCRPTTIGPALAALLGVSALAASQQETPTFRSGVRLVDVDVVVTDSAGKPVRDLAADDFEIIEDGRRHQVRTFSLINLPLESPAVLADRHATSVEPDVATNLAPEGRTYVLLLDEPGADLRGRHVAERWLDEVVQEGDRVAVVHAQGTFADAQTFTSSRRLILNSINRMLRASSVDVRPSEVRQIDTLRAIEQIARNLGTIAGRRKAIVWIGGNLDLHAHARLRLGQRPDPAVQSIPVVMEAWRNASRAAIDSNVAIYPVDPSGLNENLGIGELTRQATMREVAEETGGVPVGVNTNDFSRGFATIVQDASVYYLLGYSPQAEHDDGQFHSIRVAVRRPGLTVRSRRGYYAATGTAPPIARPVASPGVSVEVAGALRLPVSVRGLGVTVLTIPFKQARNTSRDGSTAVLIAAHIDATPLSLDSGRSLRVAYRVLDVEGQVAVSGSRQFGLKLSESTRQQVLASGLRFVEQLALRPGRYELRLVAEQEGGPLGSVVTPLEASAFDEPVAMSGLAISASGATVEVSLPRDPAAPPTSLDPTVSRMFRPADTLRAFAEVYTDGKASPDDLAVTSTLTMASGAVLWSRPATPGTALRPNDARRRGFEVQFALSDLPPGSYVLTLRARSLSRPERTVVRQIPFSLRE